jgi:hypothetical protein
MLQSQIVKAEYVEIAWAASSASGASNGSLSLWLDGTQAASLTGLKTYGINIEHARLGEVSGVDANTSGTVYFDDFVSHRSSYIGLVQVGYKTGGETCAGGLPLAAGCPHSGGIGRERSGDGPGSDLDGDPCRRCRGRTKRLSRGWLRRTWPMRWRW